MRRISIFFFLTVLCVLAGCSVNYTASLTADALRQFHLKDTHHVERQGKWTLNTESKLFVTHIQPGLYQNSKNNYKRTRLELSYYLNRAFSQVFPNTVLDASQHSLDQAIAVAQQSRSDILIYPKFGEYINNIDTTNEMSEGWVVHNKKSLKPDFTQFQLMVIEVKTGRVLDVLVVKSQGRFFSEETRQPRDLFENATYKAVQSLSGIKLS